MTAFEIGGLSIDRQAPRQAGAYLRAFAAVALIVGLAGCSSVQGFVHRTEGGQIAKPRPAPPGVARPYPNLASVPARPTPPDQKALDAISQSLVADRENARHLTLPPPPDPSSPSASPALFGVGTLPPPPPAGSPSATLAAVETPPAPNPATARPAPTSPATGAPAQAANPSAPPPQVPASPPAPPRLAALSPPAAARPAAAVPAPKPPPPAPSRPAAAPSLPVNPASTVDVAFAPTSAVLPAASAEALRALAKRRGAHAIAVVGRGDTDAADPAVQSQAVSLGLKRAEAIAQALAADGVPANAVRLNALANGRGGSATLVE